MRRLILSATVLLLSLVPAGLSQAEQRGVTCTLDGSAKFKPGLTTSLDSYKFSFKGKLSDCQSTSGVTAGTVKAKGTAEASCQGGTAEGKATVKWENGKKTTLSFSTVDVGASVTLRGNVTKSTESSLGTGDNVLGQLVFEADATQCQTGLKKANFLGQVGGGNANPY